MEVMEAMAMMVVVMEVTTIAMDTTVTFMARHCSCAHVTAGFSRHRAIQHVSTVCSKGHK